MTAQLILPIEVEDQKSFDNFMDAPNQRLVVRLKQQFNQQLSAPEPQYLGVYLWGELGNGKSHLLAALVRSLPSSDVVQILRADNLKLRSRPGLIYILDDLEGFTTSLAAEQAFLTVLEKIKQQNALLLITASVPIRALALKLADLSSRLSAMEQFELLALNDAQKRAVLCQRAEKRGIELNEDILNWLFTHTSRELGLLLDLLDQLDVHSLAHKRKVTIPLIKSMLSAS
ncbi:MAG: hypothetical protein V3V09_10015 [Arenicellales bacterium]